MPSFADRPRRWPALLALAALPAAAGQLAGTVQDAGGRPVAGALVAASTDAEAKDAQGRPRRWLATSDAAGRFAFDGFPPGPCHVTANAGDAGSGLESAPCTGPDADGARAATIVVRPLATRVGGHVTRVPGGTPTPLDRVVVVRQPDGDAGPDLMYASPLVDDAWSLALPPGAWMAKALTRDGSSGSVSFVLPTRTAPIDFDLARVPPSRPELARELKAMVDKDQAARQQFELHGLADKAAAAATARVDRANLARLERIVRRHGWPTAALVGQDGMGDFWLLAQHAPQSFIARALPHLKAAADRGEIAWSALVLTIDRDLTHRRLPQVYGTQTTIQPDGSMVLDPVQDEAHLDERRAQVGLGPEAG